MKRLLLAAPLALLLAAPAQAAGGLVCRTAGARPIELWVVVSHTAVPSAVSARLSDNGRAVAVQVAQSWLEPTTFMIDLVDPNAVRHELRLSVRKAGQVLDGTIWRGGKRRWVRCREA